MSKDAHNDRLAKLSLREKLGYGLGDAGFNFYWAIIGSWLFYFYTDIFGISAAAAGTMFFVTKFIDAATDPAMGAIADATNTRWGKFRPYLLFGALPMAGAAVLTMSTPDLNEGGKLIWAYGTYSAMMLTYTILSTPYSSLSGVITSDTEERNSIFGIRFFFAYATGIFVGAATPDLAAHFGGENEAKGWQMTMALYSAIATLFFVVTFFSTKERVKPPASQKADPIQDIVHLFKCKPWLILFCLALIIMVTLTLRGSSAAYYFKYYVNRPDLMGLYIGIQMLCYAIGAISTPLLLKVVPDKARLLIILMSIVGILSVLFAFVGQPKSTGVVTIKNNESVTLYAKDLLEDKYVDGAEFTWSYDKKIFWIFKESIEINQKGSSITLNDFENKNVSVLQASKDDDGSTIKTDSAKLPTEIIVMFILNIFISLALGPKSPLTWSMYADSADYNEWKTGRRATAMTFSAATFSQKVGSALAGILMGTILSKMGYAANMVQSPDSSLGIVLIQTVVPGIFAFISVFILRYYDLGKQQLDSIQQELKDRELARQDT